MSPFETAEEVKSTFVDEATATETFPERVLEAGADCKKATIAVVRAPALPAAVAVAV
jgi:hypothetical protein